MGIVFFSYGWANTRWVSGQQHYKEHGMHVNYDLVPTVQLTECGCFAGGPHDKWDVFAAYEPECTVAVPLKLLHCQCAHKNYDGDAEAEGNKLQGYMFLPCKCRRRWLCLLCMPLRVLQSFGNLHDVWN